MNDLDALAKLVQALSPWRAHLVIIGGWAHRIHRFDPRGNQLEYKPVFTHDTDLAFANRAPIEGDMKTALIEHGFKERLVGEYKPPVAHYTLGEENGGFYAEFLTPLIGSGMKRSGEPDATISVGGISAQKIRNLDILLVDPWVIKLNEHCGVSLPEPMDVQVAHPLCFMLQKFLIQKDRSANKKAQDVLYIYDTIELFGAMLDEFQQTWRTRVKPVLGERLSHTVLELSRETFFTVNDMTRRAALIPQDRKMLTPERIQKTCQFALAYILGET